MVKNMKEETGAITITKEQFDKSAAKTLADSELIKDMAKDSPMMAMSISLIGILLIGEISKELFGVPNQDEGSGTE